VPGDNTRLCNSYGKCRRRPLDGMPSRVGSLGSRIANGARRWDGFPTGRWLVPARLTPQSRATAAYPPGRPGARGAASLTPRLSDKPATTAAPLGSGWMKLIPGRGRATSVDHLATSFAASIPIVQHAVHTPATAAQGGARTVRGRLAEAARIARLRVREAATRRAALRCDRCGLRRSW
jgi:hypothetical protein